MTVVVMGVVGVLVVAIIFVVVIGGEIFLSGFFSKLNGVDGMAVGDVTLVRGGDGVILVVGSCRQTMVLGSQFEMVGCFKVGVAGFFVKLMIALRYFVVRHDWDGFLVHCYLRLFKLPSLGRLRNPLGPQSAIASKP